MNAGGVGSSTHIAVLDALVKLPQASIEVNVLVCDRLQPSVTTAPVVVSNVGAAHASNAEATPSAALISSGSGLQPRFNEPPLTVNKGGVRSVNQFTILDAVDILPQSSIAVNVLVWVRLHPLLIIAPSDDTSIGMPQASVAVPTPSAAVIEDAAGLQPRFTVP